MIYAYAVCDRPAADPPPRRRGLGGAALRVALADGLAVLYSRHRTLRPRPSPEAMWAHERAVEALMERGAVLPMRFGTMMADEAALTEALAARRDELAAGRAGPPRAPARGERPGLRPRPRGRAS